MRGYVETAAVRGEPWLHIATRDVLPNIAGPLFADLGVRMTGTITLVASANFLGLGLQPPAADWALMVAENRTGLTVQPWAVVAPAAVIAILTIAVNLGADQIAAGLGRGAPTTDDACHHQGSTAA